MNGCYGRMNASEKGFGHELNEWNEKNALLSIFLYRTTPRAGVYLNTLDKQWLERPSTAQKDYVVIWLTCTLYTTTY